MSSLKLYRVCFTSTSFIRIDLEASSEDAAIEAAEHLYLEGDSDDPRFVIFGGEAFAEPSAGEC